MVATLSTQRFFFSRDEGHWHAYRDDSRDALCGQAQITYGSDPVADALPSGAVLHDACQSALNGEPVAEPTSLPEPKKSKGKKSKKA